MTLCTRIRLAGLECDVEDISLADIAFEEDGKTYLQAEIKKYADMLASIKDQRYFQQSASMEISDVPFTFYLVVVPGHLSQFTDDEQKKVEHALTHLQLTGNIDSSHIGTIFLTSEDPIFSWIYYVSQKLRPSGLEAPLSKHVKHVFTSKNSSRTQRDVFKEQLCRINEVSEKRSKILVDRFENMSNLIHFLETHTEREILTELLSIGINCSCGTMLMRQILTNEQICNK